MAAVLKLTHKAIGVEIRRGTYDVVLDGERVGSLELNNTIEIAVEPGRQTLKVRNGRNSSRTQRFDAADGEVVAFRCSGKRGFFRSFSHPSWFPAWHSRSNATERAACGVGREGLRPGDRGYRQLVESLSDRVRCADHADQKGPWVPASVRTQRISDTGTTRGSSPGYPMDTSPRRRPEASRRPRKGLTQSASNVQ
jgi:hypothetical protein